MYESIWEYALNYNGRQIFAMKATINKLEINLKTARPIHRQPKKLRL